MPRCDCHAPATFGHVAPCPLAHPQPPAGRQIPPWFYPWTPIPGIDGRSR
jgi:hypothetical protein